MAAPTKTDMAVAAIKSLEIKGEEVTLEAVQKVVKSTYGQDISKALVYSAKTKAKKFPTPAGEVAEAIGPVPPSITATPSTTKLRAVAEFADLVSAVEMARMLLDLAGGDKDAVRKLIDLL